MSPAWSTLCFAALAMTCGWTVTLGGEVFASSAHLRMLAEGEEKMRSALDRYVEEERLRVIDLQRIQLEAKEMKESNPGLSVESKIESMLSNPLSVFHLMRRFAETWKRLWSNASNFTAYEVLRADIGGLYDWNPTDEDMRGAKFSLLRLQTTYDLPVADLLSGIIVDRRTKPLSQQTAVETGFLALEMGQPDSTLEWLEKAANHTVGPLVHPSVIFHGLGKAHAMKGDHLKALEFIKEAVRLDPTNPTFLRDLLPSVDSGQGMTIDADWLTDYRRLCRNGAFTKGSSFYKESNHLSCSLKRSKAVPFLSYKVEPLYDEPPGVTLFHDFVSDKESKILRDMSLPTISRARVGNSIDHMISHARLGKISWLYDELPDSVISRISRRISEATDLNTTYPTAEPLQLSNYGMGGHYEPHHDYDTNRYVPGYIIPPELQLGDRIATLMIYLNQVEFGGATVFPRIDLWTKPIKNAAVFWYNYKSNGDMDENTLHAACPVLLGEKWVANKWIRERGQEFHRRCDQVRV